MPKTQEGNVEKPKDESVEDLDMEDLASWTGHPIAFCTLIELEDRLRDLCGIGEGAEHPISYEDLTRFAIGAEQRTLIQRKNIERLHAQVRELKGKLIAAQRVQDQETFSALKREVGTLQQLCQDANLEKESARDMAVGLENELAEAKAQLRATAAAYDALCRIVDAQKDNASCAASLIAVMYTCVETGVECHPAIKDCLAVLNTIVERVQDALKCARAEAVRAASERGEG